MNIYTVYLVSCIVTISIVLDYLLDTYSKTVQHTVIISIYISYPFTFEYMDSFYASSYILLFHPFLVLLFNTTDNLDLFFLQRHWFVHYIFNDQR